jgi:xanthosine utilization system XapX-like protein
MRNLFTLGSGLFIGLIGAVLFLRAGIPPALAALVFWLVGGVIGISLLQFAFLKNCVQQSAQAAKAKPLRSFLTGLLVLEIPILAASCFQLAGAPELAGLAVFAFFGALLLILWPANVAFLIGQRLLPEESKPRQVAAGSFIAATSLFVPVLGWLWLFYLAALTTGGFCLRGRYA